MLMKLFVTTPFVLICAAGTLAFFCCSETVQARQPQANHAVAKTTAGSRSELDQEIISKEIIAKEKSSWDLAIKRDADAYKALHASNFFTVSGGGVTDRSHSEASALDAGVRFDQYDLSDFSVTFMGSDAVLVTYRVKATGLDHDRKFVMDSYATSLWMKQNGRWLNAFYQATPAKPQ
jgi:hypothetical protein